MNDADETVNDLISRHFDGVLAGREAAVFADRLTTDAAAALEFARSARVHALLETAYPLRLPSRRGRVLRWIGFGTVAAAACAVLAVTGSLLMKPANHGIKGEETTERLDYTIKGRQPLPEGVRLRTVRAAAAATTIEPAGIDQLLRSFVVDLDPSGMRVFDALRALEREIQETNYLNRPELDDLRFGTGEPNVSPYRPLAEEDAGPVIKFGPPGVAASFDPMVPGVFATPMTVHEYLTLCGLMREVVLLPHGTAYRGPKLDFNPLDKTSPSARLMSRNFAVRGDLLGRLIPLDADVRRWRFSTAFGVNLGEDETHEIVHGGALSLDVTTTAPKLDRIGELLRMAEAQFTGQHYITSKFVLCPPSLLPPGFDPETGTLMSDPEFQMFMRRLSQANGVNLNTAPSVVTRPGQPSVLNITTESAGDWLGFRNEFTTTSAGETIQVSGMVDLGLRASQAVMPDFTALMVNQSIANMTDAGRNGTVHARTGYDLWIPDRYTAIITLDAPSGDRVALMCLTATKIDAAGQPVSRQ